MTCTRDGGGPDHRHRLTAAALRAAAAAAEELTVEMPLDIRLRSRGGTP
ncbi:hypothetical protein [Micromonospora nigra]|nr:hypothetical protein [Micromonospora nigra]